MANINSSTEDLEMLKKMFLKLDTDKNGTLNIEEIKKGMQEIETLRKNGSQDSTKSR